MRELYARALTRVLAHEGGKVDDPRDPGGRTNQGVTQRVYSAFRQRRGAEPRDVFQMSPAERDAIYKVQYWDVIRGDALPAGVDYVVFDGAVNSGPVQSVKWLQRALGVKVDGQLGEATLAAAAAYPDHDALIGAILDRRMTFLRALKTWPVFGKGWTRRIDEVRRGGQAWATGLVPAPATPNVGTQKAPLSDARKPASAGVAATLQGLGGSTGIVAQATDALAPVAETWPKLRVALQVATALGAVALVIGIYMARRASVDAAKLADALDVTPAEA